MITLVRSLYVGIFDSFYKLDSKKLTIYQSAGDKLNQRNFYSCITDTEW